MTTGPHVNLDKELQTVGFKRGGETFLEGSDDHKNQPGFSKDKSCQTVLTASDKVIRGVGQEILQVGHI